MDNQYLHGDLRRATAAPAPRPIRTVRTAQRSDRDVLGTGRLCGTGYTFSHWNTAADDSGTSYNPAATFSITANVTLYAQWTINTYTVTYDANGGTERPDRSRSFPYNSTNSTM